MKWHLTYRDELSLRDDHIGTIISASLSLITTSGDVNLKLFRDPKQSNDESFIDYYSSLLIFIENVAKTQNMQTIDWLRASMKITSYEKLKNEEFDTTIPLLFRAQRIEIDYAVLDAREGEPVTDRTALSTSNFNSSTSSICWNSSFKSPVTSKAYFTSLYLLLLLSTGPDFDLTPSSNAPCSSFSFSFQSQSSHYRAINLNDGTSRHSHRVICYSCNQPDHISPYYLYRPKE